MRLKGRRRKPRAPETRRLSGGKTGAIREELLASLIAGKLGPVKRAEAAEYLARNPEAREVLMMASRAMRGHSRDISGSV